jgi:putative transposase
MAQIVKRACKYRFYPTPEQASQLARTFGCVRLVYNKGLEERTRAYTQEGKRVSYAESSAMLTAWKRSDEFAFLCEVSCVPLQQALRHLQSGFANFFAKRAKACLKVAKVYARIADRRRDHLHKVTTRLVRENQAIAVEDLNVRNLIKNHRLARAISDAAWRQMRSMLEYKARWYGRTLVVVDRWLPSSRLCSACGALQETMPLNVREWECACGAVHDRDVNAARNVLAAGLAES